MLRPVENRMSEGEPRLTARDLRSCWGSGVLWVFDFAQHLLEFPLHCFHHLWRLLPASQPCALQVAS